MTAPPDSTVTLRPLRGDEFDAWRNESAAGFSADLARAADLGADEAVRQAREAFDRLFPDGLDSPGQLVWFAYDGAERVGMLWLSTRTPRGGDGAFIYEIRVAERYRGRGYGRAIMLAAEQECRARDIDRLELNVFGGNDAAIGLYTSLGYAVTSQQMRKHL